MKRLFAVIISLLLVCNLCGCNAEGKASETTDNREETTVEQTYDNAESPDDIYREHQTLTSTEAPFDMNKMMRITIHGIGLENVIINDLSERVNLYNDTYGQVYLLADDRYGGSAFPADHYLAVVIEDNIIVKDTSKWENQACYSGDIELCDLDGDSDCEIVLQETIGITGGAGAYLSRVFDFKNGEICEIFSSVSTENGTQRIDTGFSIKILPDNKFEINNSITNYSDVFCLDNRDENYYQLHWYEEDGTPKDLSILVDSFLEFYPIDIDCDGVFEIKCTQYVSLIGHNDGIGWARCVLKYNKVSAKFEIVETTFEVNKILDGDK